MRERNCSTAVGAKPSTSTFPAVGRRYPASIENVVVLPAPFGPMSPKAAPAEMSKLRPSTAVFEPKRLPSLRTLTAISAGVAGALGRFSAGELDIFALEDKRRRGRSSKGNEPRKEQAAGGVGQAR